MTNKRMLRILTELNSAGDESSRSRSLCLVCSKIVVVTGAGIMIMTDDKQRGSICSSNSVSALIEDLQYTLGEGPCIDAYRDDQPVTEADLQGNGFARWPGFAPAVLSAGVRAVFGFPMRVGGIRLGAMNLYRDRIGPLSDDQHADALVMAGVAARVFLGMSAKELEDNSDLRLNVHQAAGMVSVQLAISVGDALIRLRAYAFANSRPLDNLANDVVSGAIRFENLGYN